MIKCNWSELKSFLDDRAIPSQYVELDSYYVIIGIDGLFILQCEVMKDGNLDQVDFETNYKALGNISPKQEVTTQFERKDFDLKIICAKASVDATTGEAVILLKIPGTVGTDFRYFGGGEAFFDKAHTNDKIIALEIVDVDNILGYGADTVIKTYHDEEADSDNQGWYIGIDQYGPSGDNASYIELEPMGFYGEAPSGLYLRVKGLKDSAHKSGTFYVNVFSGKRS